MCEGYELYYMEHMAAEAKARRDKAEKQTREGRLDAPRQPEPAKPREEQAEPVPV